MSLVDTEVPKLKDRAMWSKKDNITLSTNGGRGVGEASVDQGLWTYNIADESWQLQQTSIKPVRLQGGASIYLSIPSFKWFQAGPLNKPHMTLGVGGRLAWADDADAGYYDMPAFVYDAQSEVIRTQFDAEMWSENAPVVMGGEMPAEAPRRELDARSNTRSELRANERFAYGLDGDRISDV
ncbi:hypothetical protein ETB97_000415 [Aspergillus alliaceus]|uniref:Uncharacterized protein n=1 Tax=Petromyces alliaceus TaxID=209559 RepID=A0A8H6E6J0_PETAA|nr:hypothetical protein ETB97_000415 [Aspergillus burnettii]